MKKIIIGITVIILVGAGLYFVTKLKPQSPVVLPYSDEIHVTTPQPNQQITSPFKITGEARGSWYFEGSFAAELYDANNTSLGKTNVTAKSAWTTENFVPFEGLLTFSSPATKKGTLVIKKDNPSGLAENEKKLTIPVSF